MASGTLACTSYWIKFFTEASIPVGEATNYAITFTDHRIQEDMLLDLNKEYLADMGITTLGDVIAILRHAKTTHAKLTREKALKGAHVAENSGTSSPVPRRSTRKTEPQEEQSASRFVDHYLGKDPNAKPMNSSPVVGAKMSKELASRLGPSPRAPSPAPKVIEKKVITITKKQKDVVPVPRVRRVLPEHEGKYKVIMPAGAAQRKKQAADNAQAGKKKSSVFTRLGQEKSENPSSSASISQKVTVTGLGSMGASMSSAQSSVFKRLGEKTVKRPATSTVLSDDDSDDSQDEKEALEYVGIFKNTSPAKKKKVTVTLNTHPNKLKITPKSTGNMSTEVSTTEGIFARVGPADTNIRVKNRLGKASVMSETSLKGCASTSTTQKSVKRDIHSRLGPQRTEVSSSIDNIIIRKPR